MRLEHREQHVALERLRLVDDHERVVERAAADVGERQHLEQAPFDDLLEHVRALTRAPSVSKTACAPGVHFLGLRRRAGSRVPGRRPRRAAGRR